MFEFNLDYASPPSDTIAEVLGTLNMSVLEFSKKMDIPEVEANGLLTGTTKINSALASKLSIVLGASKQFWLNRQMQYDQSTVKISIEFESEAVLKNFLTWLREDGESYFNYYYFPGKKVTFDYSKMPIIVVHIK